MPESNLCSVCKRMFRASPEQKRCASHFKNRSWTMLSVVNGETWLCDGVMAKVASGSPIALARRHTNHVTYLGMSNSGFLILAKIRQEKQWKKRDRRWRLEDSWIYECGNLI